MSAVKSPIRKITRWPSCWKCRILRSSTVCPRWRSGVDGSKPVLTVSGSPVRAERSSLARSCASSTKSTAPRVSSSIWSATGGDSRLAEAGLRSLGGQPTRGAGPPPRLPPRAAPCAGARGHSRACLPAPLLAQERVVRVVAGPSGRGAGQQLAGGDDAGVAGEGEALRGGVAVDDEVEAAAGGGGHRRGETAERQAERGG